MPLESDIRPEEAQFVVKLLHEKGLEANPADQHFIEEQLKFLDRFVTEQQQLFANIPTIKRSLCDAIDIENSRGMFRVGFDNDEANFGMKFVCGVWDNQSWSLDITIYQESGDHRLHSVSITHQGTRVLYRAPKKYDTAQVPKGLLPTFVEVNQIGA